MAWPVSPWKLEEAKLGRSAYKEVALNLCRGPVLVLLKLWPK